MLDATGTKRQLELEMEERLVALAEKKQALEERKSRMPAELQEKNMLNVQMFAGIMTSLNPDWRQDDRLRLQLEDSVKNAFFTPGQPLITNGEAHVPPTRSIAVSQLAQELGLRFKNGDLSAIGRIAKKTYIEQHGEAPSTHRQWVDGVERERYSERDRPIVESAIREYVSKQPR